MISTRISTASAALLAAAGLAFLFAADVLLPILIPGFSANGAWLGQIMGAAWLGIASLNWQSRTMLLGGIYGRSVVMTNALLYFVTAMVLINTILRDGAPLILWIPAAIAAGFAIVYGWLLRRGPLESDLQTYRARAGAASS